MSEEKNERYESMNKMLKICEKPKTKDELIKAGIPRSTVYRNIPILIQQGKLYEISSRDQKGRPVMKYQWTRYKNVVDSDYLKLIMGNFNCGILEKETQAFADLDNLLYGSDEIILDENFIKFLIEEDNSNKKELRGSLAMIANKLVKDMDYNPEANVDKERGLLKSIWMIGDSLEDTVLDTSKSLHDRYNVLSDLNIMRHPKRFDIAFHLLQNMDSTTKYNVIGKKESEVQCKPYELNPKGLPEFEEKTTEFEELYDLVKSLIITYSQISYFDCRRKLYAICDLQKDEIVKKNIIKLLDWTSIGYKDLHGIPKDELPETLKK